MSQSNALEKDFEEFADEFIRRLIQHGYAVMEEGKLRLTAEGIKAANPRGRQVRGPGDLRIRLIRLAGAVALSPFEVVPDGS